MAVLTWRNVDTPNLNSGVLGTDVAARLFGNATSGLSDSLGNFGKAQTVLADNAAAQAASQYQDPNALKAALANGSLLGSLNGVDPTKVSAATVGDIQKQVGTLLTNAATQQTFDKTAYDNARTQTQNSNLDAAAPAIAAMAAAANNQDHAGFVKAAQDPTIAHLTPDQILAAYTKGQGLEQGNASLASTNIGNDQSRFNLATGQRNDKDNQTALAALSSLLHSGDGAEAFTRYNTEFAPNLSPGAAALTRASLEQKYGPLFGTAGGVAAAGVPGTPAGPGAAVNAALTSAIGGTPGSVAGLGGAPLDLGTPGTQNGGVYNVTYGNTKTDAPITTMSLDDITKKGGLQDQLLNNPQLKNSPVGAYQINQATLKEYAAKTLGANWQNTTFTPDVQDQIAKRIFDDNKGGNLVNRWDSLKSIPGADKPGAFANVSWDQMKQLIQRQEGTAQASNGQDLKNNVTQLMSQIGDTTNLLQGRIDSNKTSGVEKAIAAGAGSNTSAADEAASLIASSAAFKGADLGQTIAKINQVSQEAGINPKAAATLIASNVQNKHGKIYSTIANGLHNFGLDSDRTWLGDTLPSGASVDDNAVAALTKAASGGKGILKYNQTQHIVQQQQQLAAAQQMVTSAAGDLYRARQRQKADPSFTGLQRYQDAYDAAVGQARLLQATAANNASVNFPVGFEAPGG